MVEVKKILTSEAVLVLITCLVGYCGAPILGITDTYLIAMLGVGSFALINILYTLFFLPAVEFDFNNKKNPIILVRNSVEQRADDMGFTVELLRKFKILSKILGVNSHDLDNMGFQIYWAPEKSLRVKKNYNYDTLSTKGPYPIIYPSKLLPKKPFSYSLKVSATPYTDVNDIDIQIKKVIKSNGRRIKLFSYLIKIKSEDKKILIKN